MCAYNSLNAVRFETFGIDPWKSLCETSLDEVIRASIRLGHWRFKSCCRVRTYKTSKLDSSSGSRGSSRPWDDRSGGSSPVKLLCDRSLDGSVISTCSQCIPCWCFCCHDLHRDDVLQRWEFWEDSIHAVVADIAVTGEPARVVGFAVVNGNAVSGVGVSVHCVEMLAFEHAAVESNFKLILRQIAGILNTIAQCTHTKKPSSVRSEILSYMERSWWNVLKKLTVGIVSLFWDTLLPGFHTHTQISLKTTKL